VPEFFAAVYNPPMPRDAEVCDVTVILKKEYEDRMHDAVEQLKKAGMQVQSTDDDNSVVEGSLETCNVHSL
jgi:hypothetical protein